MQTVLTRSHVSVIKASGHINAANTTFQRALMSELLCRRHASLIVDMTDVESLDSTGLMVFVSALALAQQLDLYLGLCNVPPTIRIIFELTQIDRVLEIIEQEHGTP